MMRIKVLTTCSTCNGEKVLSNSIYEDFGKWSREWRKCNPNWLTSDWIARRNQAEQQWWSHHGYDSLYLPPEELDCFDCKGSGEEETIITLAQLAVLLIKESG